MNINRGRILIKLVLSIIYISIIGILVYSSYELFKEDRKIIEWKDVEKTNQYTYLEFDQMSEAFAKVGNKQIHFVRQKEDSGAWHTYLIAINKSDYEKYKPVIDYTYKRTETVPDPITVYGYPTEISDEVKQIAIKNIDKFVPVENEIVITDKNFDEYLTNTYLDTTIPKQETTDYYIVVLLTVAFIIFIILIYTLFEKDKTNINKKEEKEENKNKEIVQDNTEELEII